MPQDYDPDDYATAPEVARIWKVTPSAVRTACRTGRIPGALQTPTGRWLIPRARIQLRAAGGNPDGTVIDSEK